jgi:hypothetical protein
MRRTLLLVTLLLLATPPRRAHAAAEARTTMALIVTSNRSAQLGRPDLQYADDDGAKYYELFRMTAAAADVQLLTELDRDTARLFPELVGVARSPTREAVRVAAASIAASVVRAQQAGQKVDFYFVFAGHGDVDRGRGFLELADGRLDAEELASLLRAIPAERSHVILDSCNSFFVINPRKPGGRRFATPEASARSLGEALPRVGVFLSTSAEAEVYEWSELQSGIFSHAVRSGLAGAADANADGQVSYEELQAFVDTATAAIRNPAYRPKVYARGPSGKEGETIFAPRAARARPLHIGAERRIRLTVRDQDGLPWIDVYKEAGTAMTLALPPERLAQASIEELEVTGEGARVRRVRVLGAGDGSVDGSVALDALAVAEPAHDARGPGDLFRMLFTRPFGPHALAAYLEAQASAPPPVFGISREDTERMGLILEHVGGLEHRDRMIGTSALVGLGAFTLGAGVWMLQDDHTYSPDALGWTMTIAGAGSFVAGGIGLFVRTPAEKLHEELVLGLERGDDPARVVARAEDGLREVAEDYRRTRTFLGWSGVGVAVAGASLFVARELNGGVADRDTERLSLGALTLAGVWAAFSSTQEYPIERALRLWESDPGIRQLPRFTVSPVPGGAMVGLGGEF